MMLTELTARRERRKCTNNRLSYWMLKRKVSTDTLTCKLHDGNATAVRLMEQGRVLPTRPDLGAITELLQVGATEIWTREQLDLLKLLKSEEKSKDWHEGQTQFRVWMLPEEKELLERSIKALGYKTPTDWFRAAANQAVVIAESKKRGK